VRLSWTAGGVGVVAAEEGAVGALARIGLAAHETVAAQGWWRLKICAFDECEWAYYDQSKNRSRSYCEYGCGNKVKTRAYRARRRAAGAIRAS
jgi:predicted RNA-binding Zn ribbon-like protein